MNMRECREEFLYDCECRRLSAGTLRNYRCQIGYLVDFLAEQNIFDPRDVRPHHLRTFLRIKQEQGCKPTYVNDLLKAHKTFFNYLTVEGHVETNVAEKVRNIKQPRVIIESFTQEDVKKLLGYYTGSDFLSVRNRTIIALLFDTGARCNEMIQMRPEDIKYDHIIIKHGKGGKERVVPKSPMLSKMLMKYERTREGYFKGKVMKNDNLFLSKTGKPLTGEGVAKFLKVAARDVGVSQNIRVSPHTCRHTFAHMQLKNGLDIYSLSRLMGHVNISITQRYLQGIRDSEIVACGNKTSPLMNL